MDERTTVSYIAFEGHACIAKGGLREVAARVKERMDEGRALPILVFDALAEPVELDLRGSLDDVLRRLPEEPGEALLAEHADTPRGPGRPKLGVVGREVTLLPRHWDWLNAQPGGASVTLRKLVESARREGAEDERRRQARAAAYRFMTAVGGDLPGYEEATRALFAGDAERLDATVAGWAPDVRDHARELAAPSFAPLASGPDGES